MKLKAILFCMACLACFASSASAQSFVPPVDGQQVRMNPANLWNLSAEADLPLADAQIISAKDGRYPSISPSGKRVIMFKRGEPGEPSMLKEWANHSEREILKNKEVSRYISWIDDDSFLVLDSERPFFRDGAKIRYERQNANLNRIARIPNADSEFVAYDLDDIIMLESKKTQTLQAISAPGDRYYAPAVSPDGRFVVFNGLKSGVNLFDIEANSVVFVGTHGTNPAFSPDGRFLVYAETSDNGHKMTAGNLIFIDLNSHTKRKIANPKGEIRVSATLSRNADKIAYETADGKCSVASIDIK